MTSRQRHWLTPFVLANLLEQPGIPNHTTSDHQSTSAGDFEYVVRFLCRVNVSVCQHRTRYFSHCPLYKIIVDIVALHSLRRPAIDREYVHLMPSKNRDQFRENIGRREPEPRRNCELDLDRVAERTQNGIGLPRIT